MIIYTLHNLHNIGHFTYITEEHKPGVNPGLTDLRVARPETIYHLTFHRAVAEFGRRCGLLYKQQGCHDAKSVNPQYDPARGSQATRMQQMTHLPYLLYFFHFHQILTLTYIFVLYIHTFFRYAYMFS